MKAETLKQKDSIGASHMSKNLNSCSPPKCRGSMPIFSVTLKFNFSMFSHFLRTKKKEKDETSSSDHVLHTGQGFFSNIQFLHANYYSSEEQRAWFLLKLLDRDSFFHCSSNVQIRNAVLFVLQIFYIKFSNRSKNQ